jgi:hypothetical protein
MIKISHKGQLTLHSSGRPNRRGFLLAEVVAGAGLAILVMGLTLNVLKRDGDLRQRNETRATLLRTAENLAEQFACLPFSQLTDAKAGLLRDSALTSTGNPLINLSIKIETITPPGPMKRVHLSGGIEGGPPLVHLWREYYPEGEAK